MKEETLPAKQFLSQIPATKEAIKELSTIIVKSVLEGEENPLEVDIRLRYMEELVGGIRSHGLMKREVFTEAEKYPEKTFDAYGATITKTSRTTYTYKSCGDPVWDDLNEQILALSDQRKRRETFLKGLIDNEPVANTETGEVINPPLKETSDSLRVTLK